MSLRWTDADLRRFEQRFAPLAVRSQAESAKAPPTAPHKREMNATETQYARELELRKRGGEIRDWRFEAIKLRLAAGAFYKPDFAVVGIGGEIELHEIKGFWREAARVRIKVAAEQYPWFRFIALKHRTQRQGGGWEVEEFT